MNHWTRCAEIVVAAALVAATTSAVAGPGERDEDPDSGLVVFGFVKDARGAPVADAKVSAQLKGGSATFYVTTGKTGAYRFPFFNGEVNPADVVIACSKPGYKQTRLTRRPVVKKPDGVTPAETECRLEQG
jgi:hypothetical protein